MRLARGMLVAATIATAIPAATAGDGGTESDTTAAAAASGPIPGIQTPEVQAGPINVGSVQVGGGGVDVGPVQAGPVEVGGAQVGNGSAEVRPIEAGPVQVGGAQVGGGTVEVGSVQAGPIETEPVTARTAPVVPSSPSSDGGGSGAGGGGSGSGSGGGGTSGVGASSGSASGGAPTSGGGSGPATDGDRPAGDRSNPGAVKRGGKSTPSASSEYERALRRVVRELASCLDSLPDSERRVLVLRSGLGDGPARSRRGVARILDTRVQRVGRLERRGLRHARALARTDGCGGGGGVSVAGGAAANGVTPTSGGQAIAAGAVTAAQTGEDEDARGGSGAPTASRDDAGKRERPLLPTMPDGRFDGGDFILAIALILLAALAGFTTPYASERLGRRTSALR
jgi:hypothetical protein